VNYEDKLTTMEAPDDQDEVSYKCAALRGALYKRCAARACALFLQLQLRERRALVRAAPAAPLLRPPPLRQRLCRYLRNITIPAVFIKKTEGKVLKDLLKPGMEDVYVVMDWNDVLPRADKVRGGTLVPAQDVLHLPPARSCVNVWGAGRGAGQLGILDEQQRHVRRSVQRAAGVHQGAGRHQAAGLLRWSR
jgi:hypothetical protein